MAKIQRSVQKVFGDNVVATDNHAVFGSLKAGSPAFSKDPAVIQSLNAWLEGWKSATVNNNAPALQDLNCIDYLFSRQIAYMFQAGIPEWDSATEYHLNSFCQNAGVLYRSIQNTNVNRATSDAAWWQPLFAGAGNHNHTDAASGGVIVAASGTQQGAVTTGAQSLAGAKTLAGSFQTTTSSGSSNAVNALLSNSFAETGTGTRTITVTNLADGQAINIAVSGANLNTISWTTTGLTQKTSPTYSPVMLSGLSIYTLLRIGSNVYISVLHGF